MMPQDTRHTTNNLIIDNFNKNKCIMRLQNNKLLNVTTQSTTPTV